MIEVLIETGTYEGGWQRADEAEAGDEPAQAILAARTLWDEAYTGVQGCRRRLTFTTYGPARPDGIVVEQIGHRP